MDIYDVVMNIYSTVDATYVHLLESIWLKWKSTAYNIPLEHCSQLLTEVSFLALALKKQKSATTTMCDCCWRCVHFESIALLHE